MSLVINTNIDAQRALLSLNRSQESASVAMERLSTGLRINSAKDDPAGLALSETMTAQINGADQSVRNSNDGISLLQTADGALQEISDLFQEIRDLKVEYENGTTTATQKGYLDYEFEELADEIGATIETTAFNGLHILSGDSENLTIQKGFYDNVTMNIGVSSLQGATEITTVTGSITAETGAASATTLGAFTLTNIDSAIEKVNSHRTTVGAQQNRLEHSVTNMENFSLNMSEARSRVRDADFAAETAELSRTSILQQAGVAVLTQANTSPQYVLSLLQG